MRRKEKRAPEGGQGVAGPSLGDLSGLVVWSIVSGFGSIDGKHFLLWLPSKLYELCSTVSDVSEEWLHDRILDSFGDLTWTDMSEEMTAFMYGTAKNW